MGRVSVQELFYVTVVVVVGVRTASIVHKCYFVSGETGGLMPISVCNGRLRAYEKQRIVQPDRALNRVHISTVHWAKACRVHLLASDIRLGLYLFR